MAKPNPAADFLAKFLPANLAATVSPRRRAGARAAASSLAPAEESEFDRRQRLRAEFNERIRAIPGLFGEQIAAEQAGFAEARVSARTEAARALAAGLSQGAPVTSGAALAAGRQAGIDVRAQLGALGLEEARSVGALRMQQGLAAAEVPQAEMEAGSAASDVQNTLAEINQRVDAIKAKYTGTFTDEGEKAAAEIRRMKAEYDTRFHASIDLRATQAEEELEGVSLLGF